MAGDHDDVEIEEKKEDVPPRSATQRARYFIWFLIKDQWFLVGIAIVTIIASQVQVPLAQQNVKQVVVSYLSGEWKPIVRVGQGG
jgi:hypothetical protein